MHALAVAVVLLAAGRGLGKLALAATRAPVASLAEAEVLCVGLGLGVLAYLVLGLGLLGWLALPALLAVVGVGLGLNAVHALSKGRLRAATPSAERRQGAFTQPVAPVFSARRTRLEAALVVVLAAMVLLNLVAALAPPTGVDPLVYHLAVPQHYLLTQRIDFLPGNYYSNQPFTVQMLYTVALALGSDSAAQVLHWALGLLAIAAIVLLGRRWYPPPIPFLAAVLFYAISDVMVQSGLALADLGASAFFLLAALALFRWLEQSDGRWLVLAGVLAGLFAASRLTNPAGVGALALLVALVLLRQGSGLVRSVGSAAFLGSIAFLVVLPWYVKSWALANNPVYPFLYDLFGGRDLLPEQATHIFQAQYFDVEAGYGLLDLLVVPWTLTFAPERLHSGQLGPLFLGLLPLALAARQPREGRWILLLALLFLPLWFWSYPRLRTLLPVLGLLTLPLAAAWLGLATHTLRTLRLVAYSTLALWLMVSLAANVRYHRPALVAGLGLESRDAYLSRVLSGPLHRFPWYMDFQAIAARLPDRATVMIWDTRGYYLGKPTIWAQALSQSLTSEDQRDPEALIRRARELGATHLAVPRIGLDDEELERLRQTVLRSRMLELELQTDQLNVYALRQGPAGSRESP